MMIHPIGSTEDAASIHVAGEHWVDRTLPGAVEFLQQFLGRCDAAIDEMLERCEIARLVVAVLIAPRPPPQAIAGECQTIPGDLTHGSALDGGSKAEARHVVP